MDVLILKTEDSKKRKLIMDLAKHLDIVVEVRVLGTGTRKVVYKSEEVLNPVMEELAEALKEVKLHRDGKKELARA